MTDAIIGLLQAHPWAIYVYLGAMLLAVGLRQGWPEEATRPRWLVVVLAIVDCLQLNPSSPLKSLARKQ